MEQDLGRSGFGVDDIRRAKRWKIPASTTDAERMALATNGAVAQWYALKEPAPVVKTHLFPQNDSPLMQNWSRLLTETMTVVPVTPTTEA